MTNWLPSDAIVAQCARIACYAGTLTGAVLTVHTIFYKSASEAVVDGERRRLTSSGRRYLIAFIATSVVTVAATMIKDSAESRLKSKADQEAQARIVNTFGTSLETFGKEHVDKGLKTLDVGINTEIGNRSKALDGALQKSVQRLNGALGDAAEGIKRNVKKSTEDALTNNLDVNAVEFTMEADDIAVSRQSYGSDRLFDEWFTKFEEHCPPGLDASAIMWRTCQEMKKALGDYGAISNLVETLDANFKRGIVDFSLSFGEFVLQVHLIPNCRLFIRWPAEENVAASECVRVSLDGRNGTMIYQATRANRFDPGPLQTYDSHTFVPRFEFRMVKGPKGEALPFLRTFGRDLKPVSLNVKVVSDMDLPQTFAFAPPKRITVTLKLWTASSEKEPLEQQFDLMLANSLMGQFSIITKYADDL